MVKKYTIECNEEQLRLLRSAVELQMRVRIGQGWAITENVIPLADERYRELKDAYDPILDVICRIVSAKDGFSGYMLELRDENAATMEIERDMWIGLENGLGMRKNEIGLSEYGLLKVTKKEDDE